MVFIYVVALDVDVDLKIIGLVNRHTTSYALQLSSSSSVQLAHNTRRRRRQVASRQEQRPEAEHAAACLPAANRT